MSLAQQPDDLKVTALNAAIRSLVAPLQILGRVMWSEKNSTGHADDVATPNGHNTPQSISLAIFLQITEAKASIRKAYDPAPASPRGAAGAPDEGVDRTCHSIPSVSSRKEPRPLSIAHVTTVARVMARSRVHSTPSSS